MPDWKETVQAGLRTLDPIEPLEDAALRAAEEKGEKAKSEVVADGGKNGDSPKKKKEKEKKPRSFVVDYPDRAALLAEVPVPFIEPREIKYIPDPADVILPDPGFITDFVNIGRGMEAPTLFYVVSAMWAISTALTRETWIKWYAGDSGKMWPNIYALLVAPPSLCKKSTVINMACRLVTKVTEYMPNSIEVAKKTVSIVNGKTTPEGLLTFMEPKSTTMIDDRDKSNPAMLNINHGSQAPIAVGEFATFLGKQKYNQGMVPILTDLYDCPDLNTEISRGHGAKALKNVYANLLGGITPDGLRLSIPEEAFGGGFMSRCVIAYQELPVRICPFPEAIPGFPVIEDLYVKFAWVVNNARGEYTFSDEARDYFAKWYTNWKTKLTETGMEKQDTFRMDTILIRIAALMRMQEYKPGTVVEPRNIQAALKLLNWIYSKSMGATEDIGRDEEGIMRNAVIRVLTRRQQMTRRKLAVYMSARKCSSAMLSSVLTNLLDDELIRVEIDGQQVGCTSRNGAEVYTYLGQEESEDE